AFLILRSVLTPGSSPIPTIQTPDADRQITGLPPGVSGIESGVKIEALPERAEFSGGELPDNAAQLDPGDYGLSGEGATLRANATVLSLDCDSQMLISAETSEGTYFIGLSPGAPWDCKGAIDRWRAAQNDLSRLGLRHHDDNGAV